MTGNKFLLDTNIVSALFKGEASVAEKIDSAEKIFLPAIVIGELNYGALYSTQIKKNLDTINRLTARYRVINIDQNTAANYGKLKAMLRKKGKPIPENDLWIAAIAAQHSLPLVTRDRHFENIETIITQNW